MIHTLDDRVVAITGAGSGIGRALAHECARRGAHVALSDIDEAGVEATAAAVREHSIVRVTVTQVDVADADAVAGWAAQTNDEFGRVNAIINNAGIALGADVAEMDEAHFRQVMDINFWGVVHGTTSFLPHLEASGEGHVVNISSVFGLLGIPSQAAYNSSKFAVRGYTEALRTELDIAESCVSATTIHPGGIRTNIARNAIAMGVDIDPEEAATQFEQLARSTPEQAANWILGAMLKNKRRALIGPDAHVFDIAARVSPRGAQWLIGRLAARAREREIAIV
ncbi:MAG: SDR family NAD(P)-dependent oxidoreductase [Actinomycetota bacterium]